MYARITDLIIAYQLVPSVHIDMVLVAVMALAMFLRPTRIHVLVPLLARFPGPVLRRLAAL